MSNADFLRGEIDDDNFEASVEKSEKSPKKKLEVKSPTSLLQSPVCNRKSVHVKDSVEQ